MRILVQKFGGTSVATESSREHVYKKIEEAVDSGYSLVVVVSAMGRNGDPYATDTLLNLIKKEYPFASKRELDVIFSCGENISGAIIASNLQKRGYKSVYLSGAQAGIITDENYADARITRVENDRIVNLLKEGNIVVAGGGQGISEKGDITTLGRGGSDTTACALGAALGAYEVDIYTDVEGIMTADPRKVKDAVLLDEISYEDCCTLANMGAKVIHPRAVETAMKKPKTKLYVKSTFSSHPGTLICDESLEKDKLKLVGVTGSDNIIFGKIKSREYNPLKGILDGLKSEDYKMYYKEGAIIITTDAKNFKAAEKLIDDRSFIIDECQNIAEISIVGSNILQYPEFHDDLINRMKDENISYNLCVTADRYVSLLVSNENYNKTLNLLHEFVVNQFDKVLD